MRRLFAAALGAFAFVSTGCGGVDGTAALPPDGAAVDAGITPADAGSVIDGGAVPTGDGGPLGPDGGAPGNDGGSLADGGGGGDGGLPGADGGAPIDGGALVDGGATTDGGVPSGQGAPCQTTSSCATGLFCSPHRTCDPAGTLAAGERCTAPSDCARGLVCNLEGLVARCRDAGAGGVGAPCATPTACQAGLYCVRTDAGAVCASPPATPRPDGGAGPSFPPVPAFGGETCIDDAGAPRAYFDVPRAGVLQDFYRLPFPNDARRTATGLDLSGHPSPGAALPFDLLGTVLRASEQDLRAFATNPTVYFRFSEAYDWETVSSASLRIVDVTASSPTYGQAPSYQWVVTYGPLSRYICSNWLALRPPSGTPLRPGTTYAVLVTTAVTPEAGGTFARSPDLTALLSATTPSDARLSMAHAVYAPLRSYLAAAPVDPSTILNATVFTTQDPEDLPQKLRTVIRARSSPAVTDLTRCDLPGGGVATSPCADGTALRQCGSAAADYVELHGRIALPIFQQGSAPYSATGGQIARDDGGMPSVVRAEPVCFALTVPRDVAPSGDGFPLLAVAHGTGGSFTQAVRDGLAAAVAPPAGGGAATLTIDLPQHGARRGGGAQAPEELFFNYLNPRAAHGNIAQGAGDLLSLAAWAEGFTLDAGASPSGRAIRFNPRLVLFAHSQGATHASLAIPYEPAFTAVVLSGNGGQLAQSLLHKRQPIDIAALLPYALLDGSLDPSGRPVLSVDEWNPALALFQAYFDGVDPVNFARRLRREPRVGDTGRHLFMTYGIADAYSPRETLQAYARAAFVPLVLPVLEAFGLGETNAPLSANITVGGTQRTHGLRQYQPPAGTDGHFVALDAAAGRLDVLRFLTEALSGRVPPIGAP